MLRRGNKKIFNKGDLGGGIFLRPEKKPKKKILATVILLSICLTASLAVFYPYYQPKIKAIAGIPSFFKDKFAFLAAHLSDLAGGSVIASDQTASLPLTNVPANSAGAGWQLLENSYQILNVLTVLNENFDGLLNVAASSSQLSEPQIVYQDREIIKQIETIQEITPIKEIIRETVVVTIDDEELEKLKKELADLRKEVKAIPHNQPKNEPVQVIQGPTITESIKETVVQETVVKETIVQEVDSAALTALESELAKIKEDLEAVQYEISFRKFFHPLQVVQDYEDIILETDVGAGSIWLTSIEDIYLTADKIYFSPWGKAEPLITFDSPTEILSSLAVKMASSTSGFIFDLEQGGQSKFSVNQDGDLEAAGQGLFGGRLSALAGISLPFSAYSGQTTSSLKSLLEEEPAEGEAVVFWNKESRAMEIYLTSENKFLPLTTVEGPDGNLIEGSISTSAVQLALSELGLQVKDNGVLEVAVLKANEAVLGAIELKDKATGEIYCTWIENGEWQKAKGLCENQPFNDSFDAAATNVFDTLIIEGTATTTTSTVITIIFEAINIPASSTASFQCKINSFGFEPCSSPKAFSGLTAGDYFFQVYAVLENGAYDPTPAEAFWTITDGSISANTIEPAEVVPQNPQGSEAGLPDIEGTATTTDEQLPLQSPNQSSTSSDGTGQTEPAEVVPQNPPGSEAGPPDIEFQATSTIPTD